MRLFDRTKLRCAPISDIFNFPPEFRPPTIATASDDRSSPVKRTAGNGRIWPQDSGAAFAAQPSRGDRRGNIRSYSRLGDLVFGAPKAVAGPGRSGKHPYRYRRPRVGPIGEDSGG